MCACDSTPHITKPAYFLPFPLLYLSKLNKIEPRTWTGAVRGVLHWHVRSGNLTIRKYLWYLQLPTGLLFPASWLTTHCLFIKSLKNCYFDCLLVVTLNCQKPCGFPPVLTQSVSVRTIGDRYWDSMWVSKQTNDRCENQNGGHTANRSGESTLTFVSLILLKYQVEHIQCSIYFLIK